MVEKKKSAKLELLSRTRGDDYVKTWFCFGAFVVIV